MRIHNGNIMDTTDERSDKYLKINSCGIQKIRTDYTVLREQGRSDYHILVILSGGCVAEINGEICRLMAGDFLIYYPGEAQKYIFKSGDVSVWCHFTGSAVSDILNDCRLGNGCGSMSAAAEANTCISKLLSAFASKNSPLLENAFLCELLHYASLKHESGGGTLSACISSVLEYLHMNYSSDIDLDDIAKKCGYSKSYISHEFSERIGIAPMKYLNNYRIRAANELIISTSLPISEIARTCGFNDPLYFCKLFKKHFGVSPSQQRRSENV